MAAPAASPVTPKHCQSGCNGKLCQDGKNTPHAKMSDYIAELRADGYTSLRERYYIQLQNSYPALGATQPLAQQEPNQVDIANQQNDPEDTSEQVDQVDNSETLTIEQSISTPKSTPNILTEQVTQLETTVLKKTPE